MTKLELDLASQVGNDPNRRNQDRTGGPKPAAKKSATDPAAKNQ